MNATSEQLMYANIVKLMFPRVLVHVLVWLMKAKLLDHICQFIWFVNAVICFAHACRYFVCRYFLPDVCHNFGFMYASYG